MNIRLAAYGLNVVQASRIFLVEPILDKSIEMQAIKRAHRIGQKNEVIVEKLICENTLDELIHLESEKDVKSEEIFQIRNLMKSLKLLEEDLNHYNLLQEILENCKIPDPILVQQPIIISPKNSNVIVVDEDVVVKPKKKVSFMFQ